MHPDCRRSVDRSFDMLDYLESALEPVLGSSDYSSREWKCLRFHLVDYRNRCRELYDGDWANSLYGIRLEWEEDAGNAEDLETPGQNEEKKYEAWLSWSITLGFLFSLHVRWKI